MMCQATLLTPHGRLTLSEGQMGEGEERWGEQEDERARELGLLCKIINIVYKIE